MKSLKAIVIAGFLSICFLFMGSDLAWADEVQVIDRVGIEVDVPVDGVTLKQTARVNEYFDSINMMSKEPNTGTSVDMVIWSKPRNRPIL